MPWAIMGSATFSKVEMLTLARWFLPISYVSAVVLAVLRMLVMMSLGRPEYTDIYSSDKRDFIIQIFIAGWPAALESGCCSDVKS